MFFLRCLNSTLTIITYLSSNVNIFRETTAGDVRTIKKDYSSCSDYLAVEKIFSEWSSTQNQNDSNNHSSSINVLLSKNSLILMYSKY